MGTFRGTFVRVQDRSTNGAQIGTPEGKGALGTADLTTSASAQTVQRGGGNFAAPADGYFQAACDTAVRVAAGEDAARGASPVGLLISGGQEGYIFVREGDTVSVIDA